MALSTASCAYTVCTLHRSGWRTEYPSEYIGWVALCSMGSMAVLTIYVGRWLMCSCPLDKDLLFCQAALWFFTFFNVALLLWGVVWGHEICRRARNLMERSRAKFLHYVVWPCAILWACLCAQDHRTAMRVNQNDDGTWHLHVNLHAYGFPVMIFAAVLNAINLCRLVRKVGLGEVDRWLVWYGLSFFICWGLVGLTAASVEAFDNMWNTGLMFIAYSSEGLCISCSRLLERHCRAQMLQDQRIPMALRSGIRCTDQQACEQEKVLKEALLYYFQLDGQEHDSYETVAKDAFQHVRSLRDVQLSHLAESVQASLPRVEPREKDGKSGAKFMEFQELNILVKVQAGRGLAKQLQTLIQENHDGVDGIPSVLCATYGALIVCHEGAESSLQIMELVHGESVVDVKGNHSGCCGRSAAQTIANSPSRVAVLQELQRICAARPRGEPSLLQEALDYLCRRGRVDYSILIMVGPDGRVRICIIDYCQDFGPQKRLEYWLRSTLRCCARFLREGAVIPPNDYAQRMVDWCRGLLNNHGLP